MRSQTDDLAKRFLTFVRRLKFTSFPKQLRFSGVMVGSAIVRRSGEVSAIATDGLPEAESGAFVGFSLKCLESGEMWSRTRAYFGVLTPAAFAENAITFELSVMLCCVDF